MWLRMNRALRSQQVCLKYAFTVPLNCHECQHRSARSTFISFTPPPGQTQVDSRRGYCTASSDITLPPLMADGPRIMWPEFFKTLKNLFLANVYIRTQLDRDFDLQEFGQGAKQALELISNKLSKGEYDDLEGLVQSSALEEIKRNMSTFTVAQREMIAVHKDDIFFEFPYEVGILNTDKAQKFNYIEGKPDPPTRLVEIMVVFHILRGMHIDREELIQRSFKEFMQDKETGKRVMICNYRFFRDFTEGNEPVWEVNLLNHYLPEDKPTG